MMRNRRGQSTVEYAVVIAVVIAALLAMQIYMKRAAMGYGKDHADRVGEQFSPFRTSSSSTQNYTVTRNESVTPRGQTTSTIQGQEVQSRNGSENVTSGLKDERLYE